MATKPRRQQAPAHDAQGDHATKQAPAQTRAATNKKSTRAKQTAQNSRTQEVEQGQRQQQTEQQQAQTTQNARPHPTSSTRLADIRSAVTTKHNTVFLLTDPNGDIAAGMNAFGLYFRDMCFLDQLDLRLNGQPLISLLQDAEAGSACVFELTNPAIDLGNDQSVPKERLGIRRAYTIGDHITHDIEIRNNDQQAFDLKATVALSAQFWDMFTIRGTPPGKRGTLYPPKAEGDKVSFVYEGADRHRRTTTITFAPAPDTIDNGTAYFHLHLPHAQPLPLSLRIELADDGPPEEGGHTDHFTPATQHALHHEMSMALDTLPEVTTDNPLFDQTLHRALADMRMLTTSDHGDTFVAAGIPWYVALFGRDSCISAFEMLAFQPELARSTLRVLASYQAGEYNDFQDAEPGKILHELRVGERANLREIPQIPYYGTVDATPWFLILMSEYVRWTGDLDLYRELSDNVDRALTWIDTNLHHSPSGFLDYGSRSSHGLANQGWKDSGNSVVNKDGSLAQPPIALVEVQGYVYAALQGIAHVQRLVGDDLRADHLEKRAGEFQRQFNERYWLPNTDFYAYAIERDNRLVQTVASNPGQTLFTGIADAEKALAVARRLVADDMFSGWGVRTLAASEKAYNPLDYQVGSVWPHDNALIALGLHRSGHIAQAQQIFTGIFQAATYFEHYRLPEVFDGFARDRYNRPVHYPVACRPQAWAAGALPLLVQAALGLAPDATRHVLHIRRPALPPWLHELTLKCLRVGTARVDLHYQQVNDMTLAGVIHTQGDVTIQIDY
jgi:glycogen debranching enzyme